MCHKMGSKKKTKEKTSKVLVPQDWRLEHGG